MLASYEAQRIAQQAQLQQQQQQGSLSLDDLKKQLNKEYEDTIKQFSLYDAFWISISDKEGNWPDKPKLFRYNKITVQDYEKAQRMISESMIGRKSFNEFIEPSEYVELQTEADTEEEDSFSTTEAMLEYYRFLASCYLKMSSEEFDRCDWGKVRLVVNACNYRTEHSFIDESYGLGVFFEIDIATYLNKRDIEVLKMYGRWISKAELAPWILNGGFMYEEDINAFSKLQALQQKGEERKQKKADKIAEYKANNANASSSGSRHITRTRRH